MSQKTVRTFLLAALAALAAASAAFGQVNPQNLPSNSVYGRLGISAGPGQAIPFSVLAPGIGFVTGTSGHTIPFLDGANTWSTTQVIPTVAGGVAAGSSVTLESTSNGSPSGDVANIFGTIINLRAQTGSGTVNCGSAGTTSCAFTIAGASSGAVTLQGSTGTYNFNLPTAAGTSGFPLLSGGGGSTAQTYGQLGNAALAAMAGSTLKGNVTTGSATPTDFTIDGLTLKASPASTDEVICWDVAVVGTNQTITSGTGGGLHQFDVGGIITGLTAGTAYWLDVGAEAVTGGIVTVQSVGCTAVEF